MGCVINGGGGGDYCCCRCCRFGLKKKKENFLTHQPTNQPRNKK